LGIALLDRGAKAVRLTEASRVFLTGARIVLESSEDAAQMAKAVAYAPSLTVELLPGALRCFRESNPGVRVQLHDLSTREMLDGLAN
jgi:DNA-binding transcriptional LysR family regulator